jgi:hypothetical protein
MSGHIVIVPWNTCKGFFRAHSMALKHCPRAGRSKGNLYLTLIKIFHAEENGDKPHHLQENY